MITSRRAFLKTAALGGASLVVAFDGKRLLGAGKEAAGQFKPNGWVRVDTDGTVTLTIGKSEMGQGVRTSLAMILADELEADAKGELVCALARVLERLVEQITQLSARIEHNVAALPDGRIVMSLPRTPGPRAAARRRRARGRVLLLPPSSAGHRRGVHDTL